MLPIPAVPPVLLERRDWTVPSPEWEEWARATFVDSDRPLCDPDLSRLESATVGFLLTNAAIKVKGQLKAGLGGVCKPSGEPHAKAQREQQLVEWFGEVPKFLITLSVPTFQSVRTTCALVNHELRHCGVETDEHGGARYGQDGRPVWCTVPHYAELNEGDLARWGADATPGGSTIVRDLARPPLITDAVLGFDAYAGEAPQPERRRERGERARRGRPAQGPPGAASGGPCEDKTASCWIDVVKGNLRGRRTRASSARFGPIPSRKP